MSKLFHLFSDLVYSVDEIDNIYSSFMINDEGRFRRIERYKRVNNNYLKYFIKFEEFYLAQRIMPDWELREIIAEKINKKHLPEMLTYEQVDCIRNIIKKRINE